MERKSMQRAAGLAIVISLALAGAQPAAAGSLSFLDRLGSFWSALNREPGAAPAARRAAASHAGTRRPGRRRQPSRRRQRTTRTQGLGLDPNGNSLLSPLDPTGLP